MTHRLDASDPGASLVLELPRATLPLPREAAPAGEPAGDGETAPAAVVVDSQAPIAEASAEAAPAELAQDAAANGEGVVAEPAPADVEPLDEAPPAAPEHGADTAEPSAEPTAAEPAGPGGQQEAALPQGLQPPWRQFAADFDATRPGPRVAFVLSGLGLSAAATEAAIKQLPPEVTLSFSPYARLLNQWIALARANGHEVLLDLPMEPLTFPEDDPGPHALLTVLDEEQNESRLDWLLRRGTSYVGVAAMMGSRFTASPEHMLPVLESLKERGLLFLDNRSSEESAAVSLSAELGLPYALNDRTIDAAQASRVAINARLNEIERIARETGSAVAMAQLYPVTIERLRDWTVDLESRGIVLAPITAVAAP